MNMLCKLQKYLIWPIIRPFKRWFGFCLFDGCWGRSLITNVGKMPCKKCSKEMLPSMNELRKALGREPLDSDWFD